MSICKCCGCVEVDDYEICSRCHWESDPDVDNAGDYSQVNHCNLSKARTSFVLYGTTSVEFAKRMGWPVVKPTVHEAVSCLTPSMIESLDRR